MSFTSLCATAIVGTLVSRLNAYKSESNNTFQDPIANPPASHNRESLSRSCKANIRPQQFHESSIGQHFFENTQCAVHYNNEKFFILARGRSSF